MSYVTLCWFHYRLFTGYTSLIRDNFNVRSQWTILYLQLILLAGLSTVETGAPKENPTQLGEHANSTGFSDPCLFYVIKLRNFFL